MYIGAYLEMTITPPLPGRLPAVPLWIELLADVGLIVTAVLLIGAAIMWTAGAITTEVGEELTETED